VIGVMPILMLKFVVIVILTIPIKPVRISMSGSGVKRSACKIDGAVSHYHPIGSFAI
jgi:hypothetical protein